MFLYNYIKLLDFKESQFDEHLLQYIYICVDRHFYPLEYTNVVNKGNRISFVSLHNVWTDRALLHYKANHSSTNGMHMIYS